MNDKKTLASLKGGQAAYELVLNKELHYVYFNERTRLYSELVFKANKQNFLHLCGLDYFDPKSKKKVSATQFYDFLKNDRISVSGIVKKKTADQKLQVISELKELTSCSTLRIIDERTSFDKLVFEKAIRSRRKIFSLALENDRLGQWVPKSLLNLKSNPKGPTVGPGHPVHCIYCVDPKTKQAEIIDEKQEFIAYKEEYGYIFKTALQRN